ncbi:hypothetical protein ACP43V_12695 [Vibrio genomosp. F10 str. 9ZC157]|uniref:Uncharacterized protein n=1 Tax=Vibrio genomosp. F10 str. ZF-129 TaxID=1187848 RepID=A0A1E5BGN0_9VIBR|nr:hypothetical protein [Vibrio genomosp. F10]OEE35578.1 hypothetical protein A1QO_19900 [Vibrio genomosp. F10 str. ZF-129]OEE94336.1 hypothetical protein A1QM_18695 [Vibrio genomosp. F10 str. 9ZC157]CAH8191361.1 conserved hypothetical protein [Vibrio aestuarianus]
MLIDETLLKLLSLIVVILVGFANLIKQDPLKRWKDDIKDDLEILSKIPKDHQHRKLVEYSLNASLLGAYAKDQPPWYSWKYKENRPVFVLTIVLIVLVCLLVFL